MLNNRCEATGINNEARRKRCIAGFTMAELLIVIAIIGVLAGVSFIAVQTHQKSMSQLEYDAIAKEIFVAAQNHLTLAKSENYRQASDLSKKLDLKIGGKDFFGADGNATADGTTADIRYFYSGDDNTSTAFDQILPFGAVELVTGGRFIIRYQPVAARVLDVFYWTDSGDSRYDAELDGGSYADLVGDGTETDKHANYTGSGLLGWCGGEGIVETGVYLIAPEIEVFNTEMLWVKVTDKYVVKATDINSDTSVESKLKLIVTGSSSGAKVAIPLDSNSNTDRVKNTDDTYTVVLDDITTEKMHFSKLKDKDMEKMPNGTLYNDKSFIPGENITIQAVAYSDTALASVAYSGEWTTNSLFGEVMENTTTTGSVTTTTAGTVKISNIRHLANLNDSLSSVDYNDNYFDDAISAVQTVDLDWTTFRTGVNDLKKVTGSSSVSLYDKNDVATKADCFLPVSVSSSYALTYNGQSEVTVSETTGTGAGAQTLQKTIKENHNIKGIVVDLDGTNANGGVFGSLTGAQIRNLALIDTSVTLSTSGNAGALVGTLTDTTVENIVAYHTEGKVDTAKISTTSGSAGGLIGSIAGTTSVSKSAASVIVESKNGDAGGLIGTSTSTGTVSGCYSGGHTHDGTYYKEDDTGTKIGDYNITATANAGGLIGSAGSTTITNCYSTCSVTGATVGGLIGIGSGAITSSYCTGKVSGTTQGAFAGACGTTQDCLYLEIINEYTNGNVGYDYLTPVPKDKTADGKGKPAGIDPIDKTAQTYNDFCGAAKDSQGKDLWNLASPYDAKLIDYYNGRYNLKTIAQLDTSTPKKVEVKETPTTVNNVTTPADFVATHYGDWPAPEIFVVNTK